MTDDLMKRFDRNLAENPIILGDRIEQLERNLKTVLDREAASYERHDAKIEALEREVIRWHGLFDEKHNLLMETKDKAEAAILDLMAERYRAEALLDKAVVAMRKAADGYVGHGYGDYLRDVLAEIEGGKKNE